MHLTIGEGFPFLGRIVVSGTLVPGYGPAILLPTLARPTLQQWLSGKGFIWLGDFKKKKKKVNNFAYCPQ